MVWAQNIEIAPFIAIIQIQEKLKDPKIILIFLQ